MDNFDFFGPNLPKNAFWGRNFKTPNSKSASPRYLEYQFSVKTHNFNFFDLNLGKLLNYVRYFGSKEQKRVTTDNNE